MKTVTKFFAGAIALFLVGNVSAQCVFDGEVNVEWETGRNYYKLIELDASKLTGSEYPKTAADDGYDENVIYDPTTTYASVARNPFGTGSISVPLLNTDGTESQYTYDGIEYYKCVFAPTHYTAAYTKVIEYGEKGTHYKIEPSDNNPEGCDFRMDNSYRQNPAYNQQGFIELNRVGNLGNVEAEGGPSQHGYVQLNNLRNVDVIQWSFSSTGPKRGVMVEIKWEDREEWEIVRSQPSDKGRYTIFSSEGYTFQEEIGLRGDRRDKVFSIRFRIWAGDERTWAHERDEEPADRSSGYFWEKEDGYGLFQCARIHRINVYALDTPETYQGFITGIDNNSVSSFNVFSKNGSLELTEEGTVEIYTVDGKLVRTAAGTDINVSDLTAGVYVVKAKSVSGVAKNVKVAL